MRLRQAVAGVGDAEVAVFRVGAQTISFEILVAIMADGDALFRTSTFCSRCAARLGLEFLASGGFSSGSARRLFFFRRRSWPLPARSASAWPSTFSLSLL